MHDVWIAGLGTANPPFRASQEEIYQGYVDMIPMSEGARALLHRVFVENESIGFRHFAIDEPEDMVRDSQDELIARYKRFGVRVALDAAKKALNDAGLAPDEVDAIVVNTCTGYLCPGLSSYVAEALPLRADVWPFDLQGMGCGGALPNLQTAYNYLQAHPNSNALTIAVEICTATIYYDESPDILVSNAIFGDGAAAAVVTNRPGNGRVRLAGFSAGLYPGDRHYLHYRTENSKLRNVLSARVPIVGARRGKEVIERLLAQTETGYEGIDHWIVHPGGQSVLDAFQRAVKLPNGALEASRRVLYEYGNMSSATVLFVLEEVLRNHAPRSGDVGLMTSFGAGFSAYAGLLEFQ